MAEAVTRRADRRRLLALHAAMHPALRWTAGDEPGAHRRTRAGIAVCGAAGPLLLAPPGADLCPDCYPER